MQAQCRLVEVMRSGDLRKMDRHRSIHHVQFTHLNKGRNYPARSSKRGGSPPAHRGFFNSLLSRRG
jgi:hypothetical protein